MGRFLNYRERLYWELFDADFVTQGTTAGVAVGAIPAQRSAFGAQNQSRFMLSNMQVASQLPSSNTAAVLAMGYTPLFYTIRNLAAAVSSLPARGNAGVSMTAGDVQWNRETWELFRKQCLVTFRIDVKPVWSGHVDQLPAGGGTYGALALGANSGTDNDIGQIIQNNGMPTPDALKRFAKPIIISSQQSFGVDLVNAVQATQGGVAPPDALNWLNAPNPSAAPNGIDYKAGFVHLYILMLRDVL